jgi:hypothetical protein
VDIFCGLREKIQIVVRHQNIVARHQLPACNSTVRAMCGKARRRGLLKEIKGERKTTSDLA